MAKLCSEHTRMLRSEAAKKRWDDPVFKEMVSSKLRKRVSLPCRCGCGEMTALGKKFVHGHNSRVAHPMKGKKQTVEAIKKMKKGKVYLKGKNHPMFGQTHTEEVRKRLSVSHAGIPLSEKHRASIGKASKRVWARISEEKKNEWAANIRKGLQCFPNKPESAILSILDSMYPGQWKFVGDGQLIISGKNPDFININGQKKIIELFGDYWHRGQNPQDRIDTFRPFGFDTLVIWEHELKNMDAVIKKIHEFSEVA